MAERRDRVEAMIRYLREHADAIEAMDAGEVRFDFGQGVSGRITRVDKLVTPSCRLSA